MSYEVVHEQIQLVGEVHLLDVFVDIRTHRV
jgi:hypothetical protein